jgi:outer membrane protein assembly factor BamA
MVSTNAASPTMLLAQDSAKHSHGIVGAPYVKYAQETGIAGGLVGLYYFDLPSGSGATASRPSSISGGVSYTQKKQFSLGIHPDLYLAGDAYHAMVGFDYKRIPFNFYGVGNANPVDRIDQYTPLWIGGSAKLTKKLMWTPIGEGLNAGLSAEVRHDELLSSDAGGVLQSGAVVGSQGGWSSGVGPAVDYDTRDNVYSTHIGTYAALDTKFYGRSTGSDFTFNRYALDVRQFIPVFTDHVIALQGLTTIATGDEPFYMMSMLGGENNMRGYYQGRFRDNDMAVLQAEYRMPLIWRFGLVGFADAGEVAHTVDQFSLNGLHYTYGAGIRFLIVPSKNIGVRADYGIAKDAGQFYLSINEAF